MKISFQADNVSGDVQAMRVFELFNGEHDIESVVAVAEAFFGEKVAIECEALGDKFSVEHGQISGPHNVDARFEIRVGNSVSTATLHNYHVQYNGRVF